MLKRNIYLSMIAVAMLIQSCNLSSNISTPVANVTPSTTGTNLTMTATPTFTPIANSDLFLPECDKTPKSGLPTESAGGTYQSWYRYTNESYGFSFAFPPDWDVGTISGVHCSEAGRAGSSQAAGRGENQPENRRRIVCGGDHCTVPPEEYLQQA